MGYDGRDRLTSETSPLYPGGRRMPMTCWTTSPGRRWPAATTCTSATPAAGRTTKWPSDIERQIEQVEVLRGNS